MFRQKSSQEVLSIVQPNSAQLFSRVRIKELSQHLMERQGEKPFNIIQRDIKTKQAAQYVNSL